MKTLYFFRLKSVALLVYSFLFLFHIQAQTFSWNGTYGGSGQNRTYSTTTSGVTMTVTINNSENTWTNTSPRWSGNSSPTGFNLNPGQGGQDSRGLLLSTNWNNTSQTITVTIDFSHLVGNVNFSLYDINDNSFNQWRDRVSIQGYDLNLNPINSSSSSACLTNCSCGTVTGASPLIFTSASGVTSCTDWGNNYVTVGTGACSQIRRIIITYSSANTSGNPIEQYVIISNLTSCIPLPVELSSFTGESIERSNLLKWETATEKNNSHFELERSINGEDWEKISTVNGAGTTVQPQSYRSYDNDFEHTVNYYRLRQVDYDGTEKLSDIVAIDNSVRTKILDKIVNTMGQEVDESYKGMKIYVYTDGTIIKKMD